jgi:hypothetical protein
VLSRHAHSMLFIVNKVPSEEEISHESIRELVVEMAEEQQLHIDIRKQVLLFDPLKKYMNTNDSEDVIQFILSVKPILASEALFKTSLSDRDHEFLRTIAGWVSDNVSLYMHTGYYEKVKTEIDFLLVLDIINHPVIIRAKLEAQEAIIVSCKDWFTVVMENKSDYSPEARARLRYYLKSLEGAQCLDSVLDSAQVEVTVNSLYERATSSVESEESNFQKRENESLLSELHELLQGKNQSFRSVITRICDRNPESILSLKNSYNLYDLLAFFQDSTAHTPTADNQHLRKMEQFFAKIDRLMDLRACDKCFIYGDQHDLETIKRSCSDKVLDIAMQVVRQARGSLLESKFQSCMAKFKAAEIEMVRNQYNTLYGARLSFSDITQKENGNWSYSFLYSGTFLNEVKSLFQVIRACDQDFYNDKCHVLNEYLHSVHIKAVHRKATAVADEIKAMLEKFRDQTVSEMDNNAKDIVEERLVQMDELLHMYPNYKDSWTFFDNFRDEEFAIKMKTRAVEKEKETFDEIRHLASLRLQNQREGAKSEEEQFSTCLSKLEQSSISLSQIKCELLSRKPFSIAEIDQLTEAGFAPELIGEITRLMRQISITDRVRPSPIFETCQEKLTAALDLLYERSVDSHGRVLAVKIEQALRKFEMTISESFPTTADSISRGDLDLKSKLESDNDDYSRPLKQLMHHLESQTSRSSSTSADSSILLKQQASLSSSAESSILLQQASLSTLVEEMPSPSSTPSQTPRTPTQEASMFTQKDEDKKYR